MKLALVGYGKMGKMMDSLAAQYGFEVVLRLDEFNNVDGAGMTKENFAGVDAAIEFTIPEAAIGNIETLASLGVNTVAGTTGWLEHLNRARAAVSKAGTGFVYASNFSVGINVFERVVAETAKLMAAHDTYEAWAWEIHHSAKKDAPSGTLLTLVESMRKAGYERKIDQADADSCGQVVDDIALVDELGHDGRGEDRVHHEVEIGMVAEVRDILDRAGREVVEHEHFRALVQEELGQVRADEARAAGDQGLGHAVQPNGALAGA